MARNASGTFTFSASDVNPAVVGTTINPASFNTLVDEAADGLTNSISKNGETTVAADIPFGDSFTIKDIAAAGDRGEAARAAEVQDGAMIYAAAGGTADAITVTLTPSPTAYTAGMTVRFKASAANTGACTLNVNTIGAKDIKRRDGSDPLAGDIVSGAIHTVTYDGTQFLIADPELFDFDGLTATTTAGDDTDVIVKRNGETVAESQTIRSLLQTLVPAGAVIPFAGTSAPSGWILCDGSAVSRTTYADLFTAIGTTYGAGDGSTTFNLPDLRGRAPFGKDDMGAGAASRITSGSASGIDGATLGTTGGDEEHTLTEAQMPSHTHDITAHTGGSGSEIRAQEADNAITITSGSTGGDAAHNNMPPTIILNYIIRT